MKRELDYFIIDGEIGGNQDWFTDWFMNVGGCGAVTACDVCIHMAREHGMAALYPYDPHALTKESYISFSRAMKPFLHPRWHGISKIELYTDGFAAYVATHGGGLSFRGISSFDDVGRAEAAVRETIDADIPVPFLLLRHQDPSLVDYEWHWFNLAGYDDEDGFKVKTVTYGEPLWMDFARLWDSGRDERGGLVVVSRAE